MPLPHWRLDITDPVAVRAALATHAPDIVVNAAAYNLVDQAETDQVAAYQVNCRGPRHLATAAAERDIPIVHLSSDYVFPGDAGRAYTEDDPPLPLSRYGITKLIGEELVRNANPRHFIVRTAWLFHTDGRNFPRRMLELAPRGPVRVVNDQTGSPTYAPHLAEALLRLIDEGAHGTYHLAGQGAATWFDLTKALFREMKIATEVVPVDDLGVSASGEATGLFRVDDDPGAAHRAPPMAGGCRGLRARGVPMKVMVTGGTGYIGAHVARALAERGHAPVILDDLRASAADRAGALPLERVSLEDTAAVTAAFERHAIEGVIHLAGSISVGESVRDPEKYWSNNLGAGASLLFACARVGVKTLLFSSTAAVYGNADVSPIPEATHSGSHVARTARPSSPSSGCFMARPRRWGFARRRFDTSTRPAPTPSGAWERPTSPRST